jgi:GT2 family glycosyltransferase
MDQADWRPRVSIILLTYNKWEFTQQCLMALAANTPGDLYELIVVDNASVDGTRDYLAMLEGDVQVIYNDINRGFVEGCNQGAKLAKGDYLLLLNNDAIPQPGWLEPLIALADADPTVGAVGSKLIYPDGRLQEAGNIIWNDATGWNVGKGGRPDDPRYTFVREVDYCSGASLLIRRDVWETLGGFDMALAPAYYEDTDICFGARSLGYKVMYQPASEVIHHEGATNGTDLGSGIKRYQAINREKFLAKWSAELGTRPAPPVTDAQVRQASLFGRDKNILVIDPLLPLHDRAAGSRRLWELLRILRAANHHVTFIARNGLGRESYAEELRQMGVEVYATDPEKLAALGHPVAGVPAVPLERICGELRQDVIWLSFWEIGEQYLNELRALAPSATIVADSVDVHFIREERRAALENTSEARERARRTRGRELAVYAAADRIVTVTEEDRQALLPHLPGKEIVVVPNVHPAAEAGVPGYDERQGLLFIGNFVHPPNLDGIEWFCRDVLPRIRRAAPDITLTIAGMEADTTCRHLAGEGVRVQGYTPDLAPLLATARLSIAPLRYAGGLKGKVGDPQ